MKKMVVLLLVAVLYVAWTIPVSAEIDYESMSIDELIDLQTYLSEVIAQKKTEEMAVVDALQSDVAIRDLFPDIEFAKVIRSALNKTSIDNMVTQDELDSITTLEINRHDGYAISSLEGISQLRNLQVLKIDCKYSTAYGADYRLNADHAVFVGTTLPDEIGLLSNLTSISIQDVNITELPESMRNLTNLKVLRIYNTSLMSIPEWIGELTHLEVIDMNRSFVAMVPESIGTLTSLKTLDLTDSEITALPDSICGLPNLQTLYVGYTKLDALPDNIGSITSLQRLSVKGDPITRLPESIEALHLIELDIDKTSIE